jgi:hypothetical protein
MQTAYVHIGAGGDVDFSHAKPIACIVIKLDGDREAILPMRQTQNGGLKVDAALLDLHQRNVTTAMEYRERILHALLSAFQTLAR